MSIPDEYRKKRRALARARLQVGVGAIIQRLLRDRERARDARLLRVCESRIRRHVVAQLRKERRGAARTLLGARTQAQTAT